MSDYKKYVFKIDLSCFSTPTTSLTYMKMIKKSKKDENISWSFSIYLTFDNERIRNNNCI